MAVFRIEKTRDYTVMSNHHLKNKNLSLKAKGLMSLLLSLPDNWVHTMAGLAQISVEGVDAIRQALNELEKEGYVIRHRIRNNRGRLAEMEYVVYENPPTAEVAEPLAETASVSEEPMLEEPILDSPILENPTQVNPIQEKPTLDHPVLENPMQLNTYRVNTEKENTDISMPHAVNPYQSIPYQSIPKTGQVSRVAYYKELVRKNIEYETIALSMDENGWMKLCFRSWKRSAPKRSTSPSLEILFLRNWCGSSCCNSAVSICNMCLIA